MIPNRGPELAAVLGVFLGLTYIFVGLRVYVKTVLSKGWGADDWLLVAAQIFFTSYAACSATGVKYGTGRHLTNIPLEDVPKALYNWWLCEIFYAISTAVVRCSIAVFLLRICVKPIHKYIIHATTTMVVVFTTFYFFLVLFQCSPVNFFWDQYKGVKGSCININAVPIASIVHSCVSFTADWILGLLPIALIYNLKMNTRTKVSLGCVLSLGLFAGVATMIRIPYIRTLAITDDFLWATTDVAIWSTVEAGLGIIAAGAATLRPLFRSFYNISSRGTHPSQSTHPSRWRNSRMGYLRNQGVTPGQSRKSMPHSDAYMDDPIQLRGEGFAEIGSGRTGRSPFNDSNEDVVRDRVSGKMGGITIDRTVVVSRSGSSDEESVEMGKLSHKNRGDYIV